MNSKTPQTEAQQNSTVGIPIQLVVELVSKIFIPAAVELLENLRKKNVTIDEAIIALKSAESKTADDYLKEARGK